MNKFLPHISLLFCLFIFFGNRANAQYALNDANQQYGLFNYSKAVELYQQAYKKKPTLFVAERIAKSYALMNDFRQSEKWYETISKMPEAKPEDILGYAKALQINSKYAEAKIQYLNYGSKAKDAVKKDLNIWVASCDSAVKWMQHPMAVKILNQSELNSAQSDWGAVKYENGFVFTSDRINKVLNSAEKPSKPFLRFDGVKSIDKNTYGWTGHNYLSLYFKPSISDTLRHFAINTGTDYHVGAASFTADEKTIFFTLTKVPDELKNLKNKSYTINVETYSSTKDASGNWTKPVSFAYNKVNNYSVGDPFITPDGKTLYFSSNMPGGKGGADIYFCVKNADGNWGNPVNLIDVNTDGNERTPFLDAKGNLYFSSDGRIGMGGLDIYFAQWNNNHFTKIQNLGYPINSAQDDFSAKLNEKGEVYSFSSNRADGLGSDDIYTVQFPPQLVFKLDGKVSAKKNNQPIAGAKILLTKADKQTLTAETDANGFYSFTLAKDSDYTILANKVGYFAEVGAATTKNLTSSATLHQNFSLDAIEINKAIRLENVFYDYNKWDIRLDAMVDLDKLVNILQLNPTINIELSSHTDSRGKDAYNLTLSQKRAESAVQYIVSKGISRSRIVAKGYGETRPVNRCLNGVKCSEAEFQQNRRTEFKITRQ
ncbi:OmpA family protein [Pedobacter aquatilis]|uniref:OmpA family protein n=1 Tax=Pedobacter aquatilis TaxID=351343 RepID=UPI00292EABBB|nr:OmpA family protein [Pedobacter aquatilis]